MMEKKVSVPSYCVGCGEPFPWANVNNGKKEDMPQHSNRVFVVHGHDSEMKESAARVLETLGLEAVILHEQPNKGKTIIEKFETYSDVGFAVVLMSPDDLAFKKTDDPKKSTPMYRARQNVILELGFFLGRLGREKVFVLTKADVETPSDYSGVIYTPYDTSSGLWRYDLVRELQAAGYDAVSADVLTKGVVKKSK